VLSLQAIIVVAGKPEKPPEKPGEPLPELPELTPTTNIVTAEPDGGGRLRIWAYQGDPQGYANIWTADNVHYDAVAIGDVDDNPDTMELVGTTGYRVTEGSGKSRTTYYKMFFDVYHEGISGVWKTSEFVPEDRVYWSNEIVIADVDPAEGNGNEVVLLTPHWLVLYKYNGDTFAIRSSYSFPENLSAKSVAVGNLDIDGDLEVVVSVIRPGSDYENEGYLYLFDYDAGLTLRSDPIFIDARMEQSSLCVSDLDGDGDLEICSTGYRKPGDSAGNLLLDQPLSLALDPTMMPYWTLAVGQLDSDPAEEIVVEIRDPTREIKIYKYTPDNSDNIEEIEVIDTITITDPSVIRGNVHVADSDGDGTHEVIAYGSYRSDRRSNTGRFYLEVFENDGSGWASVWSRGGGEYGEYEVWDVAVG
jgi:hypothetical protein